jgi:NAD(P) transhydrogenase subunit alpha
MYSRNVAALLRLLIKNGSVTLDIADEIVRETIVTHKGEIVNAHVAPQPGDTVQ